MLAAVALRHIFRTLVAAWLILSVLFLLSRSTADPDSQLRTMVENSNHTGVLLDQSAISQQLRHRYGLDTPLFYATWQPSTGWRWHGTQTQYHTWLRQLLHGNLGYSYRLEAPVWEVLKQALRYTLPLTLLAAALSIALALGLATATSYRPAARQWLIRLAHILQSFPLFLLALGLLLLLANPDVLSWFPAFGLGPAEQDSPGWSRPGLLLYQLTLPIMSLVLGSFPALTIQLDGALRHELTRPYIATARAKGYSPAGVVWRHALRNALLPTVTLLTELLPGIVAGSVVVEVIFALPGMGRLLADAALNQDFPVLLGGVGLVAIARLGAQLLADVLYLILDPRIRPEA